MQKETKVYGFRNSDKLDPIHKKKYSILRRIAIVDAAPLAEHYGLELALLMENQGEKKPLYEKYGCWAVGMLNPQANSAKIEFSDKAVKELSDLAFEGLVYHEISELFLGRFAAEKFPMFLTAEANGELPYSRKESMADFLVEKYFKGKGLVPFRVETANINCKEEGFDIKNFQEYLSELGEILPEVAVEIKQKVDFKDKLLE